MYSTPYAHLPAREATVRYATSARPDAPVVASRRRLPAVRIAPVRAAAALALHRLADAVAPHRPMNCTPVR